MKAILKLYFDGFSKPKHRTFHCHIYLILNFRIFAASLCEASSFISLRQYYSFAFLETKHAQPGTHPQGQRKILENSHKKIFFEYFILIGLLKYVLYLFVFNFNAYSF